VVTGRNKALGKSHSGRVIAMKCINENHDHTETNNGVVVDMKCSHCGEALHFDEDIMDYIHDNQEHTCWLHSRAYVISPCMFNVQEILDGVLPEFVGGTVNWSKATARETSDLLNNLRDGFSEFWGVQV
jgi:hypothetical protein